MVWLAVSVTLLAAPAHADAAAALRQALARAAAQDWPGAAAAAKPAGAVAYDIIEWQRLRAGKGPRSSYEAFLARRPDWPGLTLLRQKGEATLAEDASAAQIVAYFGSAKPGTATGSLQLARALAAIGRPAEAEAEAMRGWTDLAFTAEEEAAMLAAFPQALGVAHEVRLDRLLWQGRATEARRMLPRVGPGWRALAEARLALRTDAKGVTALIAAVPAALQPDPGLAFERFVWRMRKGMTAEAAALIEERSVSATSLGDPAEWADRRASLARQLMREGSPKAAYRIASQHWLRPGADYADLEFLSGFIALRKLDNPTRALQHFQRLRDAVATPISVARAYYWQGRAQEALGAKEPAALAFSQAAEYQTAYYGLLAAEHLGLNLDARLVAKALPADWRKASFAGSSVLEAAKLLAAAGDRGLSKRFFLHLEESVPEGELAQLADVPRALGEPHIALLIAKAAAERGVILPDAYFPVPDLVPDGLAVSRALALSIARRESEFDPVVVSPAGAKGLMQVMPGTARLMAKTTGQTYAEARLTNPGYNVTLGSAYLRQLIDEFGPSIALVASGYNAGPGRPRRWIGDFGDPRDPATDVVDWVETIPFTETRTYVMRVVESVVIYRAKLKGKPGPIRVQAELRG